MKTKITLLSIFAFLFFITGVKAQCTTGTKYPTSNYPAINNGNLETITNATYAGEYSIISGIIPDKIYTFSSSVSTDYITITDSNNTVLTHGLSGLSWIPTTSENIRYYIHADAQCTTQQTSRIRYIKSITMSACNNPTALNVSNITSTSCQINWTAEGSGFDVYVSTSNTTPSASVTVTGSSPINNKVINGLSSEIAYYYWVRTNCASSIGTWAYGGTFTTNSFASCNGAYYGLYPPTTFSPTCSGSTEQIVSNSWAGQYSNVNIVAGKKYTFSSSVPTDYITITNADGTSVYASGPTPLNWSTYNTTGVIRYYIHSDSMCGAQNINRNKRIICTALPCEGPSNIQTSNVTSNSCKISWSVPPVLPDGGYEVYLNTTGTQPTVATIATKTTTTNSINPINGLNPNTTYYYWVRSVCGAVKSAWVRGEIIYFRTNALLSCNGAANGLYPQETFTPAYTGTDEQIATDSWAGQYSNVNIMMHKQYTFTSSVASDYITITNDTGNEVYATGKTPLNWQSYVKSGKIRYYIHSNSSCAAQTTNRTRSITCTPTEQCEWPVGIFVQNITSTSAAIGWWWLNNYDPVSSYQIFVSSSPDADPTTGTATGGSTALSITANQLQPNTVYYFYVRKSCTDGSVTPWISGGSFKTLAEIDQSCNGAFYGLFPITFFTPANTGALELITDASTASQFSYVSIVADKQYTFQSSISTDYLTITNFEGTVVLAKGTSPLTWNSGSSSDPIRYYLHSQADCGASSSPRSKYIKSISSCITPSALTVSDINTKVAKLSWIGNSSSYQYYYSTVNSAPEDNYPTTSEITSSKNVNLTNLIPETTYYFWIRSVCSDLNSVWVNGGSFTTFAGGCITGIKYPSTNFTPSCTGVAQTITTQAYAGQYSVINITSSTNYIFNSSVAADYITITNEDATVVYAYGTTPLNWSSNVITGSVRFYIHSDSDCGSQYVSRTRTITCYPSVLGCKDAVNGLWPLETFSLNCSGNNETITTNAKTGQYSNINVADNKNYTFTSSVATDYITITNMNGTLIYASGTTPLVWKSNAVSETIRYHLNTNASCGVEETERTKSISCVHPVCSNIETLSVTNITSNSSTLELFSLPSGGTYQYYVSTQNVAPNDSFLKTLSSTKIQLQELNSATVYYYWVRIKCNSGGNGAWTTGSFTTGIALQCNGTAVPPNSSGLYPLDRFTPACTGSAEIISTSSWAGEFSMVTIIPNKSYAFTSSVPTDYITITTADGNTVLAHGVTPQTWSSNNNSGTIRYFIHANASCGGSNINRVKSIICSEPCATTVTPQFTQVEPICPGETLAPLPINSNNGIFGTWSPALNNTETTTYTFTPNLGQCASSTTMTITMKDPTIVPTFSQVGPICSGSNISPLPVESNNGIHGTWSPALNNKATTTYIFNPAPGQCAVFTTMTISVRSNPFITPEFTQVGPICPGSSLSALPVDSNNGIHGTWSPALNNTATTTYTFIPAPGQCAFTTTMTIAMKDTTPVFTQVAPICAGSNLNALPVSSNNGINGSWSPALNNTATTTYTFTPAAGQCAVSSTMTITVYDNVLPVPVVEDVNANGSYILPALTNGNYYTDVNGSGIMLEAGTVINTSQTIYIFDTNGECSDQTSFYVLINQIENAFNDRVLNNTTSIENADLSGELKIYPNPSYGQFIVETGNISVEKITVVDNVGRIIKTVKPSSYKTDMDIAEFADGVYFIKIENKGSITTKKLVLKK